MYIGTGRKNSFHRISMDGSASILCPRLKFEAIYLKSRLQYLSRIPKYMIPHPSHHWMDDCNAFILENQLHGIRCRINHAVTVPYIPCILQKNLQLVFFENQHMGPFFEMRHKANTEYLTYLRLSITNTTNSITITTTKGMITPVTM